MTSLQNLFLKRGISPSVVDGDYQFKVILLGDGRVGKTSLRKRYMGIGFTQEYLQTIGVDMAYLPYQYEEFNCSVVIWDIAGQDEFRLARQMYYAGSNAALFVFDMTRDLDLDKIQWWMDDLLKKISPSEKRPFFLAVLANKMDLVAEHKVDDAGIEKVKELFSTKYPMIEVNFFKTSALTGDGVDDAFTWVIEETVSFIQNQI